MANINFDTGLVTYNINGKYSFTANPTDAGFIKKLYGAFEALQEQQEIHESDGAAETFNRAAELDAKMRGIVDNALGEGASSAIFGAMNLYAFAGGVPVWLNLWFSIIEEVSGAAENQRALLNPRLEEYMARYKRK